MSTPAATADDFLAISPRIRVMPIIHGSGDFAIQVREELLSRPYDCFLPHSKTTLKQPSNSFHKFPSSFRSTPIPASRTMKPASVTCPLILARV
jgi:hypothetical protein